MAHGHEDGTVTEVPVADVKVGMVRAWNEGRSSLIYAIERKSPRSKTYRISYQSTQPRPDGHKNTVTVEASGWLPILTDSIANPRPLPTAEELKQPIPTWLLPEGK